jgi:alpha-methylacyl-CoA racemase
MTRPLEGVRILDFSTLLPGPLATVILAEAGAQVLKLERPGGGDEMRREDADFAMLNRGKMSLAIDLKDPAQKAALLPLIETADVLVEQFRPGVMDRLGLGFDDVKALNPRLIYCSINGYGSTGPKAQDAGHDLTYAAEAGLLGQTKGPDGAPVMPQTLIADIGAGAYPAVINILMALLQRERTGVGCRVEVAMYDNLFPFLYPALASAYGRGHWPKAGDALETGASPRYRLYRTADDRWIAAAPAENKFWRAFCAAIDLPPETADGETVAARIATRTAAEWEAAFAGGDCASAVVRTFEEATADPHFAARDLLKYRADGFVGLPLPLNDAFRGPAGEGSAPRLDQDRERLKDGWPI